MTDDDQYPQQVCRTAHRVDPDRQRRAVEGTVLCRGCIEAARRALTELASFPQAADRASYEEAVSAGSGAPTTGTKEHPLVYNDRRAEHKREVRNVLASWCQLIAEERHVAVPDDPDPAITCRFLLRHHDWAVAQLWAEDYQSEITSLGRRAHSLLNPSGVRTFTSTEMPCSGTVIDEDSDVSQPCPGFLTAILRPAERVNGVWIDGAQPSELVCMECGFTVEAADWLSYGRKVMAREEAA